MLILYLLFQALYVSPDGESIVEIPKDINAQDYKNCVVALKRSWSFKVRILKYIISFNKRYSFCIMKYFSSFIKCNMTM